MNTIWSKYIQGAKTLYYGRKLRFDDKFASEYNNEKQWDTTVSITMVLRGIKPNVTEICKTASKVI